MIRTLRPIVHRDSYTRETERELIAWLRDVLFAPIAFAMADYGVRPAGPEWEEIRHDEFGRQNAAQTALEAALISGQVQFADGVFSGKFSAAITRELKAAGARYDTGRRVFTLSSQKMPDYLRAATAQAASRAAAVTNAVFRVLDEAAKNIQAAPGGIDVAPIVGRIIEDAGKQFIETTLAISPDNIALAPEFNKATMDALTADYFRNLDLGIKNFAAERIPELRARVAENAFKFGSRTDRLAEIIQSEFGVAKRKAEFLADQETGLLVSKYRKEKYTQLGIGDYIWSTSHDNRVRESHARLDGKRFSFASPPCTTVGQPGPARFCNPGEDYRCRCVPRPIVDLEAIIASARKEAA